MAKARLTMTKLCYICGSHYTLGTLCQTCFPPDPDAEAAEPSFPTARQGYKDA